MHPVFEYFHLIIHRALSVIDVVNLTTEEQSSRVRKTPRDLIQVCDVIFSLINLLLFGVPIMERFIWYMLHI